MQLLPNGRIQFVKQHQGTATERSTQEEYLQTTGVLVFATRCSFTVVRYAVAHLVLLSGLLFLAIVEFLFILLTLLASTMFCMQSIFFTRKLHFKPAVHYCHTVSPSSCTAVPTSPLFCTSPLSYLLIAISSLSQKNA